MKTLRLKIDPEDLGSADAQSVMQTAAEIIRGRGVVAFPTETVYGLGANALDAGAVEKIFRAKERPAWDPLIVHVYGEAMLSSVIKRPIEDDVQSLMYLFWPGPLTLLLPRSAEVPNIVTAGRPLVGVRVPAHPVAQALIAASGVPIAAPSANRFGRTSPTRADHVLEDLDGRIDAVLDAGETTHGLESTVVDASVEPVVLYRPGTVTIEKLRAVCGEVVAWKPSESFEDSSPESLPSPGVGIRHYAPKARLVVIREEFGPQTGVLLDAVREGARNEKMGVLLPAEHPWAAEIRATPRTVIFDWGSGMEEQAHRLFAGLRELDAAGVELILCPLPPDEGLGRAIQDRLLKAAKP